MEWANPVPVETAPAWKIRIAVDGISLIMAGN